MDNEAITFNQPTGPRSPSRREVLWNELARLHAQLGIAPPTATYARADRAADGVLARRARASFTIAPDDLTDAAARHHAAHHAGAVGEDALGEV
jgi:hypothetical protein